MTRENKYCWTPINETPFTLGLVFPEPYGLSSIKAKIDTLSEYNFDHYFKEPNWRVHPNWVYCKVNPTFSKQYYHLQNQPPQEKISLFLKKWKESGENVIEWIKLLSYSKKMNSSKKLLFCKLI